MAKLVINWYVPNDGSQEEEGMPPSEILAAIDGTPLYHSAVDARYCGEQFINYWTAFYAYPSNASLAIRVAGSEYRHEGCTVTVITCEQSDVETASIHADYFAQLDAQNEAEEGD